MEVVFIVNRVVTTGNYTVSVTGDDYIIMADTSSNVLTVTLPTIDSGNNLTIGRIIHVIDTGGNALVNNITISGDANISGASNLIINGNYNSERLKHRILYIFI